MGGSGWPLWPTKHMYLETGDLARLPAQLAGRLGQMNWNCVRRGKKYFVLGPFEQQKQDKISIPSPSNHATEEGPLSYVIFELPLISVSTVSRGHPSVVSLIVTIDYTYSINNPCLQDVDGAERITRFTILYGGAQSRATRVNKQSDVYVSQVLSAIILYIYCIHNSDVKTTSKTNTKHW